MRRPLERTVTVTVEHAADGSDPASRLLARARTALNGLVHGLVTWIGGLRARGLFFLDVVGVAIAVYVSLGLRSDWLTEAWSFNPHLPVLLMLPIAVRPAVNYAVGLYRPLWRHAGVLEVMTLLRAALIGSVVSIGLFYLMLAAFGLIFQAGFPRSYWVLEGLLSLGFMAGPRFAILAMASDSWRVPAPGAARPSRALLYGAGAAGALIARSARTDPDAGVEPVGFLDDDRSRRGQLVAGLPVFGSADELPKAVGQTGADVLLITMPGAPGAAIRRVTEAGAKAGLEVRIVPSVNELLDGSLSAFRIRRVRVEDLIRRPEVARIGIGVEAIVRDRVVLVTGAGGSIGSELARQVFALGPRRLVLVERGESAMFAIQRELEEGRGDRQRETVLEARIANIASRELMRRLLEQARPDVVLHAAACKHVPLMESHPSEAVQVNVGGTLSLLDAAVQAGVPRFVLVSTDKAVAPTSAMGATKRIAEWLTADVARRTARAYVAVRFGNVLGSTGSVIPIFRNQLENGKPLTLTHPAMTRYFMTIGEASALILDAAALGHPGDVFVLDMGEPLRILDLARDFVRLAGRDPETVPIVFTGLRPGERLHERLFYDNERRRPTSNPKVILADAGAPPERVRDLALNLVGLADGQHEELLRERLFATVENPAALDERPSSPLAASSLTADEVLSPIAQRATPATPAAAGSRS
jgi:FlaA1/EpsC-like NDP-sugar epimerase